MTRIIAAIIAVVALGVAAFVGLHLVHRDGVAQPGVTDASSGHHEEHTGEAEPEHQGHDHEAEQHEGHGHEGHGHEDHEGDLDRPVAELISARCEHDTATVDCDECRYEVGFVRVAPDVLAKGLVKTSPVSSESAEGDVVLPGEIGFDERRVAHVTPIARGIVRSVHVGLGQPVKRGDRLFDVDSPDLAEAQSELLEARATARLTARNARRITRLRKAGVAAEREVLAATTASRQAAVRLQAAQDRVRRLGMVLDPDDSDDSLRAADGRLEVRAPLDGRVLEMHVVPGEVVGPDESVMLVGDLSSLWMWGALYESDLGAVQSALDQGELPARVVTSGYPGETFTGRADLLGAVVDTATRTVKLRIVVDNDARRLRPGMFAEARLQLPGRASVLTVPEAAVLEDEGREFVFVRISASDFVRRPVVTMPAAEGRVAVRVGLEAGQEVVSRGAFLLKSDVLREKMGAGCAD